MIQIAAIVVLFFLQCQADLPPVAKDLDENKIQGQWIGIAVASNCKAFLQMKSEHIPQPINIYTKMKDHMKSSTAFQTKDGCQQMDVNMETVEKGHYKAKTVHGDNEVVIAGTDYDTYLMEITKTVMGSEPCTTVKLFGRKEKLPEERVQHFKDNIKQVGLKDENYVRFQDKATCVPKA